MMPSNALLITALASAGLAAADPPLTAPPPGQAVFAMYCAACHGPQGAGLVGPNLTDNVFLHGGRREDLLATISKGVDGKGMPAWEVILSPEQLAQVTDYAASLIGKNLPSPVVVAGKSTVTPFPKGTLVKPLLMRSFMPVQNLDPDVLSHFQRGLPVANYSPEKGEDIKGTSNPIPGIPTAIAVNFGDQLSYCFDTTGCRLLYTWSGGFMDMTKYWGSGSGGSREKNDYVPVVLGTMAYRAKGPEPVRIPGSDDARPVFHGYRKLRGVPQLQYDIGKVAFTATIVPGDVPGSAICRTSTTGATQGLVYGFHPDVAKQVTCDKGARNGDTLTLSAADAADFTITIAPSAH